MRHLIAACLTLVGIIHLLPLSGVLGAERLAALYGLDIAGNDLAILMRHRAVLFGIVGGLLIAGAFVRALRLPALIVGFVSVVAFLGLALSTGGYNTAIARVVTADWIALALLVVASVAHVRERGR